MFGGCISPMELTLAVTRRVLIFRLPSCSCTSRHPKANYSLVPAFRRDNPINVKEPANLFRLAASVLLMCLVSPLVVCVSTPPEIIYHRRWLSVCFLYRFIFCRVVWIGKVIERSELRCLVSCIYLFSNKYNWLCVFFGREEKKTRHGGRVDD